MKVQEVQLEVYDLAGVHIDRKAVVSVGDDAYTHSYALGLETLVHISKVRTLDQRMDWEVGPVQFVKTSRNHGGFPGKWWVLSRYV